MQDDKILVSEDINEYWGGEWTETKNDIVYKYANAYLQIMKDKKYWKLLYFDGFAGEGIVKGLDEKSQDMKERFSSAFRIIEIDKPRSFDMYYLVELNKKKAKELDDNINSKFLKKTKSIFIISEDCNKKLVDMSKYLQSKNGQKTKVLAFVDPYGMEINWESIECLKGLSIDLWILLPTGIGINRLLKRDGNISDEWMIKLEKALGLSSKIIKDYFYKKEIENTLFGEISFTKKQENSIDKIVSLYKDRLSEIFEYVSNPYELKNSNGNKMYHLLLASNNKTAQKIANDIIKLKN